MALFHWQPAPYQYIMNFGKIHFKAQKSPYLHKMKPKPMVQNPWQYYLINLMVQAHGTTSHFQLMIQARVSSVEFLNS